MEQGGQAASLAVAENYVKVGRQYWAFDQSVWFASECLNNLVCFDCSFHQAFGELAKESNTLLLPSNAGDVTGMVTQVIINVQPLSSFPTPL